MARSGTNLKMGWAEATFMQAYFDYCNGCRLLDDSTETETSGMLGLAVAQFQQSSEKFMKAMVLLDNKQKSVSRDAIILTHTIWLDRISHEAQLRGIRDRLLELSTAEDIQELESMAPQGSTLKINTEYPWQGDDDIEVPADYFSDLNPAVERFMRIAKSVFISALDFSPKFKRVKERIDQEFQAFELTEQFRRDQS